jgi:hypothetical protein
VRRFRARGFLAVPALPASSLDGKEGVEAIAAAVVEVKVGVDDAHDVSGDVLGHRHRRAFLFPGVPIHVQRLELQAPHDPDEWVHFPGATYVEHDGEAEVLPGIRLLPTPGHTPGHQSVLVDTPDGLVVIGGDVAYTFDELESGATEGQRRVLALAAPTWLTHAEGGPRVPRPN